MVRWTSAGFPDDPRPDPQVFRGLPLLAAYEQAAVDGFVGTDTAACFQQYREESLQYCPGDTRNIKITYPDDLVTAEEVLRHAGSASPDRRQQAPGAGGKPYSPRYHPGGD